MSDARCQMPLVGLRQRLFTDIWHLTSTIFLVRWPPRCEDGRGRLSHPKSTARVSKRLLVGQPLAYARGTVHPEQKRKTRCKSKAKQPWSPEAERALAARRRWSLRGAGVRS